MGKIINYKQILSLIFLLGILIIMFTFQYHTPISFDSAMNFQVSANMNRTGRYATNYDSIVFFDHNIQTGAPVILLTSVLNLFTGIKSNNMQIVTALMGCLLVFLIFKTLATDSNPLFALFGGLTVLFLPSFLSMSYLGLGETTMGLFMVLTCLFFAEAEKSNEVKYYIFSGLCLGIGYLTKTITLICCPIIGIMIIFRLITKKGYFKNYLIFAFSFILPIVIFEFFKLSQLGLTNYLDWWKTELSNILGQAGVTDKYSVNDGRGWSEAWMHIDQLCNLFNINFIILCCAYVIPFAYFIFMFCKKKNIDIKYLLFYGISLIYLFWWTFMSPESKLWARRILMGIVLLVFVDFWVFGQVYYTLKKSLSKKSFLIFGIIYCFVLLVPCVIQNVSDLKIAISVNKSYKTEFNNNKAAIQFLNDLPEDSVFWGAEWWQNPTIAVMGDIMFYDLSRSLPQGENNYFVQDTSFKKGDPNGINKMLLSQYDAELVYTNNSVSVYHILERKNLNNTQNAIMLDLSKENDFVYSVYYALEEEDFNETKRSIFHSHMEEDICIDIFENHIKKFMFKISGNGNDKNEIIISNLSIKNGDVIIKYDGQELYDKLVNSIPSECILLDNAGNIHLSFVDSIIISIYL